MTPVDADQHRRRAEEFIGALDLEYYQHFSGQKAVCDFTAIYDRFPELFTKQTIDELEADYKTYRGEDRRAPAYLLAFMVDGFMGAQTKELTDEIANAETQATIEVDGEVIGLRQASIAQANEADRERRQRIQDARLAATEEVLNPRLDRLWRTAHDLARVLGYDDYMSLYSEVKGTDYLMLRAQMEGFLQDTEGIYERSLDKLAFAKMGLGLSELRSSDLPYLWRAAGYDRVFTAERLLPTFTATLAGMGIDLAAQTNVHIDAERRELKSPRAFCSPVRVPDEIYLCVMPKGGQDDYGALLHEGGHTEHFAHADPSLPFEFRHLGDNSVTEGFAFIFDHLLLNPRWLERYLDFTDSADFLTLANVIELHFLRRYSGKLAYETILHAQTGSLDGMAQVYSDKLSDAVRVDVPSQNYLADVDDGFYAASYLRAWLLEGAFRMILQDRYSMEWFRNPKAIDFLRQLWSHGQHFNADQLLLKNGGGKLDADPLKHHIERALGR